MSRQGAIDRKDIVIGRALPFSVYAADRKLLLAKGQLVTDRIREALLRDGVTAVFDDHAPGQTDTTSDPEPQPPDPLDRFRQHYTSNPSTNRCGFRISRDERSDGHTCWVVGLYEPRALILTAPMNADGTFLSITPGQSWLFRTFYATAAFRFVTTIRKVFFEPFPHFHVELPATVDTRTVRRRPRVHVCIPTKLATCNGIIVDLSSEGARIALNVEHSLNIDEQIELEFKVTVMDQPHVLKMRGSVVTSLGATDERHPQIHFYGMRLQIDEPHDGIMLHAYVHERLVSELDGLSRVLSASPAP